MEVVVASHRSSLLHDTGPGHPESADRVRAVRRGIDNSGVAVARLDTNPISRNLLALAHDASYIETLEQFCSLGGGALDVDTVVSEESWDAALAAAGAVVGLVGELAGRRAATGFAITRPPGHHAFHDRAMGFCLFNNVAVAAMMLSSQGGRVAIIDWDVHHGNGTQAIVGHDPNILYVSLHQDRHYPYAGRLEDIDLDAPGTNVNIPLPAGTAGDVYRRAWSDLVLPIVSQAKPDWLLVSAGYDGHVDDPLADLMLTADDFGWLSARLAEAYPAERVVVCLEGGYDLVALEESASSTIRGLCGVGEFGQSGLSSPPESYLALERATAVIERHWSV